MKRILAILMAAIMCVGMAVVSFAGDNDFIIDFEDETAGDLGMAGTAFPEIKEESGNKFIHFEQTLEDLEGNGVEYDEEQQYVSGGVDGYLRYTGNFVEVFGNEFVIEMKFRVNEAELDYPEGKQLFQIQPKAVEGWVGNIRPFKVVVDGGKLKITGQDADKAYAFEMGKWYDVALCWDFSEDSIVCYVNGTKAYTTKCNSGDSNISGYQYVMFGFPDKVGFPFNVDIDDFQVFSGTEIKYTGDKEDLDEEDVPTGDITAVVALVAVLACGTGIVASKKH